MRAACFQESGKPLEIRDVPDPEPGPGEVLLAVKGCGICGSDLHVTELGEAVPAGAVMGHEFAGEIVAVGRDAKGPDGPWTVEPLAVGLHAVEKVGLELGEDVLIVGAGPVGLACAIWAKLLGAREVVVSDYADHRRELAIAYGATASIDPRSDELGPAYERITGRAPTLAFECVGRPEIVSAISLVMDRGGRIMSAGMCMAPDTFMPLVFGTKELSMHFASYYTRQNYQLTVDMLAAERIDPLPMITDRIGLDALPEAFEALRQPSDECKVVVQP